MKPCKHLDYETQHIGGEIKNCGPDFPEVRYWRRQTERYDGAPVDVQFCKLRGRINNIVDCYEDGPVGCHES